jgi:hypothetical protein
MIYRNNLGFTILLDTVCRHLQMIGSRLRKTSFAGSSNLYDRLLRTRTIVALKYFERPSSELFTE